MLKKIFLLTFAALLAALPVRAQGVYTKMIGGDAEKKNQPPEYTYLYDTSLIRAIKANDADRIRLLLYANIDANEKNDEGYTPLVLAADRVPADVIRLMIQRGAYVNMRSKNNITPLMAAATANRPEVVNLFLEYGADPSLTDDEGMTAFAYAVKNKNSKTAAILAPLTPRTESAAAALSAGEAEAVYAGENTKDNLGKTPLIIAVDEGNRAHVKELLSYHIDIEEKDNIGRTALMHAVQNNNLNITKDLLAARADIETADLVASTPLILAAKQGNLKIAEALVKANANVNAADKLGRTPLSWALANNDVKMADFLKKKGAFQPAVENAQEEPYEAYYEEYYSEGAPAAAEPGFWGGVKDIDAYIQGLETQIAEAKKEKQRRAAAAKPSAQTTKPNTKPAAKKI